MKYIFRFRFQPKMAFFRFCLFSDEKQKFIFRLFFLFYGWKVKSIFAQMSQCNPRPRLDVIQPGRVCSSFIAYSWVLTMSLAHCMISFSRQLLVSSWCGHNMSTSLTLRYLTVPCHHLLYSEPVRLFSSLPMTHSVTVVKLSSPRYWFVNNNEHNGGIVTADLREKKDYYLIQNRRVA